MYNMGFGSEHLMLDSELVLNATFPDCGIHGESAIAIHQSDQTPASLYTPAKVL